MEFNIQIQDPEPVGKPGERQSYKTFFFFLVWFEIMLEFGTSN